MVVKLFAALTKYQSWLISPICAVMAAIELYTPQGAEMVSGMIYEPYEQGY